jgi:hypothetical protein
MLAGARCIRTEVTEDVRMSRPSSCPSIRRLILVSDLLPPPLMPSSSSSSALRTPSKTRTSRVSATIRALPAVAVRLSPATSTPTTAGAQSTSSSSRAIEHRHMPAPLDTELDAAEPAGQRSRLGTAFVIVDTRCWRVEGWRAGELSGTDGACAGSDMYGVPQRR